MLSVMKPDLTPWLGHTVHVVVDRPLGSHHPRGSDLVYPVNAGELPGTLSGDGHPVDAYLLGWDEPLREVTGEVVSVIVHLDDVEEKRVVVRPPASAWRDEEIMKAVWFQEQYFDVRLVR
ncbi:inorganic pyrophosphatase [Deinococcus sp. DB0503]|nr:inorganic pyrophosphatase [Deinococcus sp. DB0503]